MNMKSTNVTGDVMFVKKTPFVISLLNNVKFTIIKNVVDRKVATLVKETRDIKIVYTNKDINIKKILQLI